MHTQTISLLRERYLQQDPYEKGRLFENYIIQLFNQDNFKVEKFHESRKISNGLFLPEYSDPDLQMVFGRYRKYRFAVECKWRSKFDEDGKIRWAERRNINSYKTFQSRNGIPVFIAIGIGGEPSKPELLFLTPLNYIDRYCHVYSSELIPYKRRPTHKFYYDTNQLQLF